MASQETRATYNEIARQLRIRLADRPSHVMVMDGDRAGLWLEIQRDNWYFQASDRDGNWGISAYTPEPNNAAGTFVHEFEGMGCVVHWLHSRLDGPDGEKATPTEVVQYLSSVGVTRGDAQHVKTYLRIEARPSRWNGDYKIVHQLLSDSGVKFMLVGQRQLIDGTDAFLLQLVEDRIPMLEAYLRRFTGPDFQIGSLDFMRSTSSYLNDTLSDADARVVKYTMHGIDSYSTAMRKLGELRLAVDPSTLAGLNVYGVPFSVHGLLVDEKTQTADLALIVPTMCQTVVTDVIRRAGLTSTYTPVPFEGR